MDEIKDQLPVTDGHMPRRVRIAFLAAELTAAAATAALLAALVCVTTGALAIVTIVFFAGAVAAYYAFVGNCKPTPAAMAASPLTYIALSLFVCAAVSFMTGLVLMLAGVFASIYFYLVTFLATVAGLAAGAIALYADGGRLSAKGRVMYSAVPVLPVICVTAVIVFFCTGIAVLSLM